MDGLVTGLLLFGCAVILWYGALLVAGMFGAINALWRG